MSQQIIYSNNRNIQLRGMAFDVNSDSPCDDVFLSFSLGMEHGPVIERPGDDSPRMRITSSGNDQYITDTELQRLGSWFISKELKHEELLSDIAHLGWLRNKLAENNNPTELSQAFTVALSALPANSAIRTAVPSIDKFLSNITVTRTPQDELKIDSLGSDFREFLPLQDYWEELLLLIHNGYCTKLATSVISLPIQNTNNIGKDKQRELNKWVLLFDNDLCTECHLEEFIKQNPFPSVAQGEELKQPSYQGCGDISMNYWSVAFINPYNNKGDHVFVYPYDEPVEDRTYTCLVKWKTPEQKNPRIEIRKLKFNRYATNKNDMVLLLKDGTDSLSVGDSISFAVYGQQIVRNGEILPLENTIHQFSDLRHIFQLPNLNPNDNSMKGPLSKRPRSIFNKCQNDDVWLAEHALLKSRNLQRAALFGPILLSFNELGATEDHINAALYGAGTDSPKHYKEVKEAIKALEPGEYRVVREDSNIWYDIYFRRNVYPYSVLAIMKSGELLSFAWRGVYSDPSGLTIQDTADFLTSLLHVQDALLIDEGGDVFQYHHESKMSLPPVRRKIRAMFFFTSKVTTEVGS